MNSSRTGLGILSLALMLPALFLCTAGLLYVAFGIEASNRLLDVMMAHTLFKVLLSAVVVLGGPVLAFVLNAWKVCHLSAEIVNEEFIIAFSVKRLFGHLLCLGLAGSLILLLVGYAFVENFKIVGR